MNKLKEEPTIQELFDEVMKRLDDIEMKINRVQPIVPIVPTNPSLPSTTCPKCGMRWEGAMAYVCLDGKCPMQVTVTC